MGILDFIVQQQREKGRSCVSVLREVPPLALPVKKNTRLHVGLQVDAKLQWGRVRGRSLAVNGTGFLSKIQRFWAGLCSDPQV